MKSLPTIGLCAFAIASLLPNAALAASSMPAQAQGAVLTLHVDDSPVGGSLTGALEIRLEPGWKTYWRDPGDAGVPPSIRIALDGQEPQEAEIAFPAPHRFADSYSTWAGYKEPVTLVFRIPDGQDATPRNLTASVFIGVCEKICVPVQAEFSVELRGAAGSDPAVASAIAALPGMADASNGLTAISAADDKLVAMAGNGVPGDAELFIAAPEGWTFDKPERQTDAGGKTVFAIPVIDRPEGGGGEAHYTIASGHGAVAGVIALP